MLILSACNVPPPETLPTATRIATESASTRVNQTATEAGEATYTPTPRPTPRPITCTDDSCLNACLTRINGALPESSLADPEGIYGGADIDVNIMYYDVRAGQLGPAQKLYVPLAFKVYQDDTAAQQRVWNYASSLLPSEQLKWITGFEIFSSSYYAAWVKPDRDDRSHWILGMDLVDAQNPLDLTIILAHEYGHLVTLNTDQIPASDFYFGWYQNASSCAQFLSPDGCSKPDSYINLFYQKFWQSIFDDWAEQVAKPHTTTPEEHFALVHDFYVAHRNLFVREYAATNIYEDMAESFQHFILDPQPTDYGVQSQKIRFYYNFPELVALRKQMIQVVCSYAQ